MSCGLADRYVLTERPGFHVGFGIHGLSSSADWYILTEGAGFDLGLNCHDVSPLADRLEFAERSCFDLGLNRHCFLLNRPVRTGRGAPP